MQSYVLLPPIFLIPKQKKFHWLVLQATGGSFLNVSKIPSDPLPEKAICQSSFPMSIVKQAGIWYSQFYSWLSHPLALTLGKSPGTNEQNTVTARSTAYGGPGRITFQKFIWAKALRKLGQKKAQQQHCHVHQFWLQKEHKSIRKGFSSSMLSPPICLQISVYLYLY